MSPVSLDLALLSRDHWIKRLAHAPRLPVVAASVVMLAGVAVVDSRTGRELAVGAFYLIPVALLAWNVGPRSALLVAFLCALSDIWADNLAAYPYSSPYLIYWNTAVDTALFAFVGVVTSALRSAMAREEATSRTDALTGIANRRGFNDHLAREVSRARRYQQPLTLVYVDCDNFKRVNDQFGHDAGDEVLIGVAKGLLAGTRGTDVAGRLGGDEFAVVLVGTGGDAAPRALEKLREQLTAAMTAVPHPVTFSIGAVTFPAVPATVEELLTRADSVMYSVKHESKDAVRHLVAN